MERRRNFIVTVLFIVFILFTAVYCRADRKWMQLFRQENAAQELLDELPFKTELIELSGYLMKTAGVRSYYNASNKINITKNGYNVGHYNQTTTDYEVEQMIDFKEYLDEKGIRLLYVSEPAKYIDDAFYQKEFGGESYLNRNTDLFLKRIGDAGIEWLDLRENYREAGIEPLSQFYRTDHHWTVPASKWAAQIIAERLNQDYGYHIDLSLYDDSQFRTEKYESAWLGEQGKKVAKSYIGLDDYTMMEPVYPTSYTVQTSKKKIDGDFGVFINKKVYENEEDVYQVPSWHYSYKCYTGGTIHNHLADYGKVLVLGDSYEASMVPFLSLGIQDIKMLNQRNMKRSVREVIEEGEYDTVIIAYAQFMIGAHDNPSNANRRMFSLE